MKGLWQSVEGDILSRFPKTARIITTDKDPLFDHGWGGDVKYYKVNYTGIPCVGCTQPGGVCRRAALVACTRRVRRP